MKRTEHRYLFPWDRPAGPIGFDGSGDGDGDGDGDEFKLDLEDPKIKAAVDAVIEASVTGLKAKNGEILGENRTLKDDLRKLKDTWGDLDPEAVKALLTRIDEDEETRLIAEGKADEVIARRTDALRRDLDAKITAGATRIGELETVIEAKDNRIMELVIDSKIRTAAGSLEGFLPSAVEDAIMLSRNIFGLDDEGSPVARDSEGVIQMGKDGKLPLSPAEWLEGMREGRPHWWGVSAGGGAQGSGVGGSEKTAAAALEKMSAREKLSAGMSSQAAA